MLTLPDALRWVEIGFCIAVGLALARLAWLALYYLWNELTDWEVKAYMKQFRGKSVSKPGQDEG